MKIFSKVAELPQKIFAVAFAMYMFFAPALPLALLNPVRAASSINNIELVSVTPTTITVTVNASQIDEEDIEEMGLCYSTDAVSWTCVALVPTGYNGPGQSTKFTQTLLGLISGETYYIKGYVIADGTTYEQQMAGTVTTLTSTPTPTPTETPTPSATPSVTPTVTDTPTPTPTVSPTPTTSPEVTETPAPTVTPSVSPTIEPLTTLPAPTITNPTGDYYNSTPILNAWTAVTGAVEYRIEYVYDDGHTFAGAPYRYTTTTSRNHTPGITEQGGVSFRVQGIDALGTYGEWSTWKHYYYDATAPTTTATGIDALVHNTPVTVSLTCVDTAGSGCDKTYYSINGGAFTEGTSAILTTDGAHTISYYSVDRAGNIESINTAAQQVLIDVTAPVAPTLLSPIDGYLTKGIAFQQTWTTVADAVSYYYESCNVNPGDAGAACTSIKYTNTYAGTTKSVGAGQPDSHFWWRVKAKDAVGNWSDWSEAWELTIDNSAPVLTLPANITTEATSASGAIVDFTATALDAVSGSITPICLPDSGTLFAMGTTTVSCSATDLAGNTSNGTFTVTVVDTTAPSPIVNLHFSNTTGSLACGSFTNLGVVTVDWNDSTDNVGVHHYNYNIDYPLVGGGRGIWNTTRIPSYYTGTLNQGIHYVKIQAVDAAGNTSAWSNQCSITYDSIAPDVQITSPVDTLVKGTIEIRGSVTDDNPHHYWLVIQNSVGTKVAGPGTVQDTTAFIDKKFFDWDTTAVPDGQYTIKLEARDAANNKDSGSIHWLTVTVDNSLPTVEDVPDLILNEGESLPTITMEVKDNYNLRKVCLTVTEPKSSEEYETTTVIEDCQFVDYLSGTSFTYDVNTLFGLGSTLWALPSNIVGAMPEGMYTFEYWAVDEAGNESVHQTTVYQLINLAPSVSIVPTTNANRSVTMTANGLDGNAPLQYAWSSGNFAACSGSAVSVTTPTTAGTYTCTVLVTDFDGETAEYTSSVTVAPAPQVPQQQNQQPQPEVLGEQVESETTPTPTPSDTPQVLGARTCTQQRSLTGTVFIDSNDDNVFTIGEKRVEGVILEIKYSVDNEVFTAGQVTSGTNGEWNIGLCAGAYSLTVLVSSLPKNTSINSTELSVILEDTDKNTEVAIPLTETKEINSWWWLLVLLALLAIAIGGYTIYRKNKLNSK